MHKAKLLLLSGLIMSLAGCNSTAMKKDSAMMEKKDTQAMAAAALNNDDLYEVHHEGRLYVFDDFDTYQSFLQVGETSYRQTFIGAAPKGETLVFGVTGKDKKKTADKIASYNMFHGNLKAADTFYGEMRAEGRIYVFNRLVDMEQVRSTGEAALRFSDIGAGPKGETIICVLNKHNKKQKPVALQTEFKKRNNIL